VTLRVGGETRRERIDRTRSRSTSPASTTALRLGSRYARFMGPDFSFGVIPIDAVPVIRSHPLHSEDAPRARAKSFVMPSPSLSIRIAREEDAPHLAAAERAIARIPGRLASRPEEIDEEATRKKILELRDQHRGIYLVAEDAGVLAGHALLEPLSPLVVTSHVVRVTLAVHDGHRRRGIGRALMDALLRWARSNARVDKVELQV